MCFPTDKSETNVIIIEGKMEKKYQKVSLLSVRTKCLYCFFTVVKDEKQVISLWSEF